MTAMRFPIGIESFPVLREGGFVYVDKTEYVRKLVDGNGYYFLSRPRRFGKSLLLSTIQAFFEGRRDLFKGLSIDSYPYKWDRHPVFRLNLVNCDCSSPTGLDSILNAHIVEWEREYGRNTDEWDFPQRFYGCIRRSVEKTGRKAVILVDEYDKTLVASIEDAELNEVFRERLKPFYATLKAASDYIRFAMITGVSRFSRLSIFSDINNLYDITSDKEYAGICGITADEIRAQLSEGVAMLGKGLELGFEDTMAELKKNYDGYHFAAKSEDIYNTFSLMSALSNKEIGSYWFLTGTPTFLLKALRATDMYLPDLNRDKISDLVLYSSDSYMTDPVPLLFQSGYLTIKDYDRRRKMYTIGVPNLEVEDGLYRQLLPIYLNRPEGRTNRVIDSFLNDVEDGDPEMFLTRLKAFLADIPYELSQCRPEIYFENNLYIIFKVLGCAVEAEYRTASGRIDLLLKTEHYIYVMELKLDRPAEDALRQIETKDYLIPFAADSRKLFKIGISFSHVTRNIDSWVIA